MSIWPGIAECPVDHFRKEQVGIDCARSWRVVEVVCIKHCFTADEEGNIILGVFLSVGSKCHCEKEVF